MRHVHVLVEQLTHNTEEFIIAVQQAQQKQRVRRASSVPAEKLTTKRNNRPRLRVTDAGVAVFVVMVPQYPSTRPRANMKVTEHEAWQSFLMVVTFSTIVP